MKLPPGVALIDGVEQNRLHPATFDLPPEFLRRALRPRMFAKIGVTGDNAGERFWAIITDVVKTGEALSYVGEINNDLTRSKHHDLCCGDRIEFGPEHVLDILPAFRLDS